MRVGLIVTAVAGVAAVVLVASSAGDSVPTVAFQAETMTIPSTGDQQGGTAADAGVETVDDPSAGAGRALIIRSLFSEASMALSTTISSRRMVIRARAELCEGAPRLAITIDSTPVPPLSVSSTTWMDYVIPTTLDPGAHVVKISMQDDLSLGTGCDRNLIVDRITLLS